MKVVSDDISKAQIYTVEKIFLGYAMVVGLAEDDSVVLIIEDEAFDKLETSFILTLCSDTHGLITYNAKIIDFRRFSDADKTYEVRCGLLDFIEVVQKRENFKVKISVDTAAVLYESDGEPVIDKEKGAHLECPVLLKDLSASGVLVQSEREYKIGQVIGFMFEFADPPFPVYAEILREQTGPDGRREYGCRFRKLNVAEEASIRRYIFRIQFSKIRGA